MKQYIEHVKKYKDPIQWHPEPNLYIHISLVTARARYLVNDINVTLAAVLHDLCKPTDGRYHAIAMFNLINTNDDIGYYIKSHGGNIDTVSNIVKYHMDKKVTKNNKTTPFIDKFFVIDDMIWRYKPITRYGYIILPNGKCINGYIQYIGLTPFDTADNNTHFTIMVNDIVYKYPIDLVDWVLNTYL